MSAAQIGLVTIGVFAGIYAAVGILRGKIYCKGGPYSRTSEPIKFWSSVIVYIGWLVMMVYFAVIKSGN